MAEFDNNTTNPNQAPESPDSTGVDTLARRAEKKHLQRITFLAAGAVIAFTLLMVVILIIGAIAKNASTSHGGEKHTDNTPADKMDWTTITLTTDQMSRGTLILSDDTHGYTLPDDDASLVALFDYRKEHHGSNALYTLAGMSAYMNGTAMAAIDTMLTDCATVTGCTDVTIRMAFLTTQEQNTWKSSMREHALDWRTGLGCDLYIWNDATKSTSALTSNDKVYNWLKSNAARYGFILRYPTDKTDITGVADYAVYFRYVGVPHATYMAKNNLSLEEYLEALKQYTSKDRLTVTADGKTYEIYMASGTGTLSVPKNYAYDVSGTNCGSVVVTIDRSAAVKPQTEPTGTTAATTAAEPGTN